MEENKENGENADVSSSILNEDASQNRVCTDDEKQFALTVGRYDEVINVCKTLRGRLLFTQAGLISGSQQGSGDPVAASDSMENLHKMEESIQCMSIQEEAFKLAKISRLIKKAYEKGLAGEVAELLKLNAANQSMLADRSKELIALKLREVKLRRTLLEELSTYIATLEADKAKLRDVSISNDPSNAKTIQKCEEHVKDIRFMQICISEIVSSMRVDLRENEVLRDIVISLRDPVTSVDQFF